MEIVAVVAVVVAFVSAVISVLSWLAARRSAREAEVANHRAATPKISITSDGYVNMGMRLELTTDTDLDELTLSLQQEILDSEQAPFQTLATNFYQIGSGASPAIAAEVTFQDLRAGRPYILEARMVHGNPKFGRVNLRAECRVGARRWVVPATTGRVLLEYPYDRMIRDAGGEPPARR